MDKDRDISRIISTPKKVGFVGGAVLAGSAAIMACGGGGAKSATTPEGGVGGAQSNPTTGQTIEVKVEASPTVMPTPTEKPKPIPSVEEISALVTKGYEGLVIDKTDPNLPDNSLLSPDGVNAPIAYCVQNGGPGADPKDPNYWTKILGSCHRGGKGLKYLAIKFPDKPEFREALQGLEVLFKAKIAESPFANDPTLWTNVSDVFDLSKPSKP